MATSPLKKSELGRMVKKWLGQGKSIEETASFLKKSPEECYSAYQHYMGRTPTSQQAKKLIDLIKNKEKVHLYGKTGSGKSYLVKQISNLLGLDMVVSSPRSEEDLLKDFVDTPFIDDGFLFVIEGDGYYWRKYGLVKKYVEDSKSALVIITNNKETPTKHITKHLIQVKKFPPTRAEALEFLKTLAPGRDSDFLINDCYDKDWRKICRNFYYGREETVEELVKIDAKQVSYKLLKGTATLEDFDNCKHPLSFILNWLGYNLHSFYERKALLRNMSIVSYVDANKYNLKLNYLRSLLLELSPMEKKGQFIFPPFKPKKKDEIKTPEISYSITKVKGKTRPKSPKKVSKIDNFIEEDNDDLGDFMLI